MTHAIIIIYFCYLIKNGVKQNIKRNRKYFIALSVANVRRITTQSNNTLVKRYSWKTNNLYFVVIPSTDSLKVRSMGKITPFVKLTLLFDKSLYSLQTWDNFREVFKFYISSYCKSNSLGSSKIN